MLNSLKEIKKKIKMDNDLKLITIKKFKSENIKPKLLQLECKIISKYDLYNILIN